MSMGVIVKANLWSGERDHAHRPERRLGESFGAYTIGDDAALLDIVQFRQRGLWFPAGDPTIMVEVCRMAADKGVHWCASRV